MISFVYDQDVSIIEHSEKPSHEFQILAVKPGLAGQEYQPESLEKIKYLRKKYPYSNIEIDGGVSDTTIKMFKEAGANIFVAASYIWGSNNPIEAYKKLNSLV